MSRNASIVATRAASVYQSSAVFFNSVPGIVTTCSRKIVSATRSLDVSPLATQAANVAQKSTSGDMSAALRWQPGRPYNALLRLPPVKELETKPVLKRCIAARAALAELKKAAELIPNPAMLINTLPLLEARASSEIENIVTTADKLFRHLQADSAADPATKEALRYRRALLEGVAALKTRPLTTKTAESICTQIKGVEMTVRKVPGTALVIVA